MRIHRKKIASLLIAIMLSDTILPLSLHALTSGPSQPEVQTFEPVGTTEMVDLFSGDFNYNIPLFELPGPDGGYPFNLAYHSGIGMDQEASWAGLGWNINAGVINRQMRGIPDDFAGDEIIKTTDMKPVFTIGIGSAFTPDLEIFGADLGLDLGVTPYYNNYKGFGYSTSIGSSLQFAIGDHLALGLGTNMTTDSYEGKNYSSNFSIAGQRKNEKEQLNGAGVNFSINYNNRQGATQIGLGVSAYRKTDPKISTNRNRVGGKPYTEWQNSVMGSAGSAISLNNKPEFVPNIAQEMRGANLNIGVKIGVGFSGALTDVKVSGFFNVQKMKHKNQPVSTPAYGFLNLDKMPDDANFEAEEFPYLLDFNREGDGLVDKNSKLLPVPAITNDIFAIAGQGVGGMFQANRSSIGFIRDKSNKNVSHGGSIGLDFGPSNYPHLGGSGTFNFSKAHNFLWDMEDFGEQYNFKNKPNDPYFESTYFKVHGEKILEDKTMVENYLNGINEPAFVPVEGKNFKAYLKTKSNKRHSQETHLKERRKRNANIQAIESKYIVKDDGVLGEFNVKYFNDIYKNERNVYTDLTNSPDRIGAGKRSDHIGGFTTLSPMGTRYVYGLPAYNTRHEEHAFSVPVPEADDFLSALKQNKTPINGNNYDYKAHGNKFKDVTEVPEYTHAFLLTSVLGNDYADLTNDGPSDDDLGYWVKFNYVKAPEKYGWRNPFKDASYIPGNFSDTEDDKGHFMYGERENWYLASAETKTHIAEFVLEEREDARGWSATDTDNLGARSFALKEILLFSKKERYENGTLIADALPIKKVHFNYTQELCKNIPNGSNGQGKLTLKELWFTYRNNQRGAYNKYHFDYGNLNPNYNPHSYDCWGNYRNNNTIPAPDYPASYPYVPQYFQDNNVPTPNDEAIKAWSLSKIKTPSGAIINIEYESDDYAYIQNKKAMQMYALSENQEGDAAYTVCTDQGGNKFSKDEKGAYLMVDLPNGFPENKKADLFDHTEQLFFKVLTPLVQRESDNGLGSAYKEFITGYADIDMELTLHASNNINANSKFKIYLKPFKIGKYGEKFHPVTIAAMDYLQLNRSDLIYLLENSLPPTKDLQDDTKQQKRDRLKAMVIPILNMSKFNNKFYPNALCKTGAYFVPDHSFVRLNNISGFKEGGGIRVKKLILKENETATDEYGQHYNYTTYDERWGKTISSGVATYEPAIGGEQNALKKAIRFERRANKKLSYNLFSEYPYNESYFPGPSVGYSKVSVKSLNTKKTEEALLDLPNSPYHDNNGIAVPAAGTTVYEYFTCKDYPVFIDATELGEPGTIYEENNNNIIPLVGQVTKDYLGLSQGYMIELNDMHGKPKLIASYGQKQSGEPEENPYNSISYTYKSYGATINGDNKAKRIKSNVNSLFEDGTQKEMLLGVDYDMFIDARASFVNSITDGANFNTDFVAPVWATILNFIPSIGHDKKEMHMLVTNKIIWRTGILEGMTVKNENAIVTTRNLAYDALTGAALLTEVQNNFDGSVYSFSIPGYWKYEGMGPAYKNLGLKITATITPDDGNLFKVTQASTTLGEQISKQLYPGDEFVVEIENTFYKAYVMRVEEDAFKIDFDIKIPKIHAGETLQNIPMFLTRSGRRNHLDKNVSTITSLINPLKDNKYWCHENE